MEYINTSSKGLSKHYSGVDQDGDSLMDGGGFQEAPENGNPEDNEFYDWGLEEEGDGDGNY